MRQGDAHARHDRIALVRFEDLVAEPQAVLTRLVEQWGLDFEPGMLDVPRMSSSNRTDDGARGVDKSVAGRGSRDLPPTEVWLCQLLTTRERQQHGYPSVSVRPQPLALLTLLVTWPLKLVLGVALNVGRTQSLRQTLHRRLFAARGT